MAATQYLLIDMGYLLFYRVTATMRYVSHRTEEVRTPQEATIDMFEGHLVSQLDKLKKKYGGKKWLAEAGASRLQFIFCKDERQCDIWRRKIYPEYKANRPSADDMIRHLQGVLARVAESYGEVLNAPGLEADDIAYLVVKRIRENDKRAKRALSPIVILTSDRDYLQLKDNKVTIIDATGKIMKSGVEEGVGDDGKKAAEVDLWTKILMGDVSDNIPPVCKGVGKKTALALAMDPVKRKEFIAKKGCEARVALNKRLIDMSEIPEDLVHDFNTSYLLQF